MAVSRNQSRNFAGFFVRKIQTPLNNAHWIQAAKKVAQKQLCEACGCILTKAFMHKKFFNLFRLILLRLRPQSDAKLCKKNKHSSFHTTTCLIFSKNFSFSKIGSMRYIYLFQNQGSKNTTLTKSKMHMGNFFSFEIQVFRIYTHIPRDDSF